jgi:hypothetical protein
MRLVIDLSHEDSRRPATTIAALLEQRDWTGAERQCDRLERYCAREPLPWSEFVIARGRAFARLGRGERNDALRETLEGLRETAARAELNVALPEIDAAVAASARADRPAARSALSLSSSVAVWAVLKGQY